MNYILHRINDLQNTKKKKPLSIEPASNSATPLRLSELYQSKSKPIEKHGKQKMISKNEQRKNQNSTPKSLSWKKLLKSAMSTEAKSPVIYQKINQTITSKDIIFDDAARRANSIDFKAVDQDQDVASQRIVQITTVVETIRRRNKRNAETLENSKNMDMQLYSKRSKRSLVENKSTIPLDKDVEQNVATTNKFYRHPELSYEAQKEKVNTDKGRTNDEKLPTESIDINSSTELYKQIWGIINSTQPKFQIVVPPKNQKKHKYVPVFRTCNDTTNNMNLSSSRTHSTESSKSSEYTVRGNESDNLSADQLQSPRKQDNNLNNKNESTLEAQVLPSKQGYSTASTSVEEQQKDKVYINLQDHQKNRGGTTSSDIPVYNPDNIPYVEVPDYSDVQEESLDEEDRQVNKKKQPGHEEVEIVDSKSPTDAKKTPSIEQTTPQTEGSDEKEPAKLTDVNPNLKNNVTTKEFEEDPVEDVTRRSNIKDTKTKQELEDEGDEESPRQLSQVKQKENPTEQDESLDFNIDDYRKPFNLEEFLGNDPMFKELTLLTDGPSFNTGQDSEYIPVYRGQHKSDDNHKKYLEIKDGSTENHGSTETSSEYGSRSNFPNKYADAYKEKLAQFNRKIEEMHKNDKTAESDGNKDDDEDSDFLKDIIGKNNKNRLHSRYESEEDFLSKYFTGDIIRKLREEADHKENQEDKEFQYKEDMYKTLSAIMDKKDYVSRLNEDVDKRIKNGEKRPLMYKNFWSLEYRSPHKKAEMEAERDEVQ